MEMDFKIPHTATYFHCCKNIYAHKTIITAREMSKLKNLSISLKYQNFNSSVLLRQTYIV